VFILLLNFIYFVATFGMYSDNVPSLGEKISAAFTNPLWLSPFYIIVIIQSNLVLTLFLIVLIVILYYLYDSLISESKKFEKEEKMVLEKTVSLDKEVLKILKTKQSP